MRKGHARRGPSLGIAADPRPDPVDSEIATVAVGAPEKGWWLKLAVLLLVAMLCIAFAGLLWALIF